MTTEIIIATRNRYRKLIDTIKSIPPNTNTWIIFDGDKANNIMLVYNLNRKNLKPQTEIKMISQTQNHRGAVYCRNQLLSKIKENVIYVTDDIIFKPNSIEQAEKEFKQQFPDNDGILGFRQEGNKKYHPTGVAMVGINFLKKYPNQWLFYPGYFHFACQEVLWHAEKIGKFQEGSEVVTVEHLNPNINKKHMDQTHHDARIHKTRDHKLMLDRKKKGLVWGYNDFEVPE